MKIDVSQEQMDGFIKDVMGSYPEASVGKRLFCIDADHGKMRFRFNDSKTGKLYDMDLAKLRVGFKGLAPLLLNSYYRFGKSEIPDLLVQFAIFGHIEYGGF